MAMWSSEALVIRLSNARSALTRLGCVMNVKFKIEDVPLLEINESISENCTAPAMIGFVRSSGFNRFAASVAMTPEA